MQVINSKLISGKTVLIRYDLDVALRLSFGKSFDPEVLRTEGLRSAQGYNPSVAEDFKLKAGLDTLELCLENAKKVILMGHLGRPEGRVVEELRIAPVLEWFKSHGLSSHLSSGKLKVLENLRFDSRESFDSAQDKEAVMGYARELAQKGDVYINEAFSAYRPSASTTVLPTLFPHVKDPEGCLRPRRAAGLHFAEEVRVIGEVRDNPKKPFVVIMGGAKVKDKLPVIEVLAKKADAVLVGGKLVAEIRELASSPTSRSGQNLTLPTNVLVGMLNEDGFDIASSTADAWESLINKAAMIIWNGPLGKFEDPRYNQTEKVAKMILASQAEVVIGGGDSVAALNQYGLLEEVQKKAFVSVGGGAMLKLLSEGTLPTIEALK